MFFDFFIGINAERESYQGKAWTGDINGAWLQMQCAKL